MSDIKCPECGTKMHKAGLAVSGRKKVQRYRCSKCGRTTIQQQSSPVQVVAVGTTHSTDVGTTKDMRGHNARLISGGVPVGLNGVVMNVWTDNGQEYAMVDFGMGQTGQRLQQTFPIKSLKLD